MSFGLIARVASKFGAAPAEGAATSTTTTPPPHAAAAKDQSVPSYA